MRAVSTIVVLSVLTLGLLPFALPGFIGEASAVEPARAKSGAPAVTAPPESFFEKFRQRDREAARSFCK